MKDREFRGVWWPENEPEKRSAGRVVFSPPETTRLHLLSDFHASAPRANSDPTNYEKILGITEEGEPVTLYNCILDSSSTPITGQDPVVSPSEYIVTLAIIGYIFENENIAFDRLSVSFYGMDEWAHLTTPRPDMGERVLAAPEPGDDITISFEMPERPRSFVDGIEFSVGITAKFHIEKFSEGILNSRHEFKIDPRKCQVPLDVYFKYIDSLRNFISLGLGAAVTIRSIEGYVFNPINTDIGIEVLYSTRREPEEDASVHPSRRLFSLGDINFRDVFERWIKASNRYDDSIQLYFGSLFSVEIYPHHKLLNFCHSLEAYHREKYDDSYMGERSYDRFRRTLEEVLYGDPDLIFPVSANVENISEQHNLPDSLVQSFKNGVLPFANEYSLRRRLEEISQIHANVLEGLPHSVIEKEKAAADTRNYHSHHTDELKEKAVEGAELARINWGLQQMIEAVILSEIGLNDSHIRGRLENKYKNMFVS